MNTRQKIFIDQGNKIIFRLTLFTLFLIGVFLISGTVVPNQVVTAASNCATSGPKSGEYSVTICFTSPTDNTLMGDVTITATASFTGTKPKISSMVFNLNNDYLLSDYQSPYTFTLPTARFVDGSYNISASLLMRDGTTSDPETITVNFQNGVKTPPVNHNTFTPALGTSPAGGKPLVVVVTGDAASGETNATKVTNLISSWNPNLMLYVGDVYEKGTPTEFYNWYGTTQEFGLFRAITDPTVGNHEYTSDKNAAGYFDYWDNIPNYYSFNAGGWHFISLNANSQLGQTRPGTAQYNWLAKDLDANTAACTIAYWHQPIYNVGIEPPQTSMQQIWALLAQHKVNIVLNGHDHDYQRWVPLDGSGNPSPTGITEFVVGSGGHGIQTFAKTDSRMVKGFDSTTKPEPFGALRFDLSTAQAAFNYINIAGTVLDSGTINCNKPNNAQASQPQTNTPTPSPTITSSTNTDILAVTNIYNFDDMYHYPICYTTTQ